MNLIYPAFAPVHRIGLHVIRDWFAGMDVTVGSRIPADMSDALPLVMVRADRRSGGETRRADDERFLRSNLLTIETFTTGLNAENDGYDLQESIRLALLSAWRNQVNVPDGGSISSITTTSQASLVSDYATSTGVVQYASLPKGAARTESIYQLYVRPPNQATISNRFIPGNTL